MSFVAELRQAAANNITAIFAVIITIIAMIIIHQLMQQETGENKTKGRKHTCFLVDLLVTQNVAEADAKKLFSSFDQQPITQFFNLTKSDLVAIFGSEQQQQKITKILDAQKWLSSGSLNFQKFAVLEEHNNNNKISANSSASASITQQQTVSGGSDLNNNNATSNAMEQQQQKKKKKVSGSILFELMQITNSFCANSMELCYVGKRSGGTTTRLIAAKYKSITRDLYLLIAPHISDAKTARNFTVGMDSLCEKDKSMFSVFCCEEIRDALLDMSTFVDFSDELGGKTFSWIFRDIYVNGPSSQKSLFKTEKVRDTLVKIVNENLQHFDESSHCVMSAMSEFAEANSELYAIASVIDCIFSSVQHANNKDALFAIVDIISELCVNNSNLMEQLTQDPQFKDIIVNIIPEKLVRIAVSAARSGTFRATKESLDRIRKMFSW